MPDPFVEPVQPPFPFRLLLHPLPERIFPVQELLLLLLDVLVVGGLADHAVAPHWHDGDVQAEGTSVA